MQSRRVVAAVWTKTASLASRATLLFQRHTDAEEPEMRVGCRRIGRVFEPRLGQGLVSPAWSLAALRISDTALASGGVGVDTSAASERVPSG